MSRKCFDDAIVYACFTGVMPCEIFKFLETPAEIKLKNLGKVYFRQIPSVGFFILFAVQLQLLVIVILKE